MKRTRFLFVFVMCSALVFALAPSTAPISFAAQTRSHRTSQILVESIAATRPGRCEVPILWWYLAELQTTTKCRKPLREVGTLEMKPQLPRGGGMSILVEWRMRRNGETVFRCTGPIPYFYNTDNLVTHAYTLKTRRGVNLISANIYTYPYGWISLERQATSVCEAP